MNRTIGQVEAAITAEIVKFEREFGGRGPTVTKKTDRVAVNGHQEATTREMVKTMRREMLEIARPMLSKMIEALTGQSVVSLHTDLSTMNGDRVIVFLLADTPDIMKEKS